MRETPGLREYTPTERLLMVVGNYGSGKTEISVNLAIRMASAGARVQIADLDIVNPYFRSREARAAMESFGIRVVVPPGAQQYADLPIVVPEIKGMLDPPEGVLSMFDVGGDDVGARMLSSFREPLGDSPYALLQVINSRRPFTDSAQGCLKMQRAIEEASRMSVTGYIVNSHLMDETTIDIVLEGYEVASAASERSGTPVEFVAAMDDLAQAPEISGLGVPVLPLHRIMLPPWLRGEEKSDSAVGESSDVPAGRVKPIGRP